MNTLREMAQTARPIFEEYLSQYWSPIHGFSPLTNKRTNRNALTIVSQYPTGSIVISQGNGTQYDFHT